MGGEVIVNVKKIVQIPIARQKHERKNENENENDKPLGGS